MRRTRAGAQRQESDRRVYRTDLITGRHVRRIRTSWVHVYTGLIVGRGERPKVWHTDAIKHVLQVFIGVSDETECTRVFAGPTACDTKDIVGSWEINKKPGCDVTTELEDVLNNVEIPSRGLLIRPMTLAERRVTLGSLKRGDILTMRGDAIHAAPRKTMGKHRIVLFTTLASAGHEYDGDTTYGVLKVWAVLCAMAWHRASSGLKKVLMAQLETIINDLRAEGISDDTIRANALIDLRDCSPSLYLLASQTIHGQSPDYSHVAEWDPDVIFPPAGNWGQHLPHWNDRSQREKRLATGGSVLRIFAWEQWETYAKRRFAPDVTLAAHIRTLADWMGFAVFVTQVPERWDKLVKQSLPVSVQKTGFGPDANNARHVPLMTAIQHNTAGWQADVRSNPLTTALTNQARAMGFNTQRSLSNTILFGSGHTCRRILEAAGIKVTEHDTGGGSRRQQTSETATRASSSISCAFNTWHNPVPATVCEHVPWLNAIHHDQITATDRGRGGDAGPPPRGAAMGISRQGKCPACGIVPSADIFTADEARMARQASGPNGVLKLPGGKRRQLITEHARGHGGSTVHMDKVSACLEQTRMCLQHGAAVANSLVTCVYFREWARLDTWRVEISW